MDWDCDMSAAQIILQRKTLNVDSISTNNMEVFG